MNINKQLLLVFIVVVTLGCQTPLKTAAKTHKTVTERWYELANYVKSDLPAYGVTVTARLSVQESDSGKYYRLSNFRLDKTANRLAVDLLAPTFEGKYVCSPVCEPVAKYKSVTNHQGYTLLSAMFTRHEYSLYRFYGDLALLNDQLTVLGATQGQGLQEYLDLLSTEKKSFDSLQQLSGYLSHRLSAKGYAQYASNPWPYYKNNAALSGVVDQQEGGNNLESTRLQRDTADWDLGHPLISEGNVIDTAVLEDVSRYRWERAVALNIKPDDAVCTYDTNLFGYVRNIGNGYLVVSVVGKAKILEDNLVYPTPAGYLFQHSGNVHFEPKNKIVKFKRDQVARCNIGQGDLLALEPR